MPKMSEQQMGLLRKLRTKSCRLHILQDEYTASKHCLSQHVKQGETTEMNSEVREKITARNVQICFEIFL